MFGRLSYQSPLTVRELRGFLGRLPIPDGSLLRTGAQYSISGGRLWLYGVGMGEVGIPLANGTGAVPVKLSFKSGKAEYGLVFEGGAKSGFVAMRKGSKNTLYIGHHGSEQLPFASRVKEEMWKSLSPDDIWKG